MVIKGNARGSPGDLAKHLQRTDTNERTEVKELRGVAATDLTGALKEMDAHGAALRTSRTLYHASINTRSDEHLTDAQRTRAIDQLEDKLGLTGQPRAVVMHEKEGRAHFHIVWARTDLENMRAIRCDHNYRKHEEVARALEKEFGHERVQGAHAERDGKERPERTPSHAEMQQAERTGLTPRAAKAEITAIWQKTDSGRAFAAALEDHNWILARGDKREFVVLDHAGEAHSLARRIDGAKAKDVRERMADIDAASLPGVEQAREQQRARQIAREEAQRERHGPEAPGRTVEAERPPPRSGTETGAGKQAGQEPQRPARATPTRAMGDSAQNARIAGKAAAQAATTTTKQAKRAGSGALKGFGKALDMMDSLLTGLFAVKDPPSPEQQKEDAREAAQDRAEHADTMRAEKKQSDMERFDREFARRETAEREERAQAEDLSRERQRTR